jgi:hypothetical protein
LRNDLRVIEELFDHKTGFFLHPTSWYHGDAIKIRVQVVARITVSSKDKYTRKIV